VPFLRVIRDKRGYETTYLMDWYRDGTKQRSRILYAFRTPGGVRVGRSALEPQVLAQIEAQHPDIAFDWKAVLETRQVIDAAPEPRPTPARRRHTEETAAPPREAAAVPGNRASGENPGEGPDQPPRPPIPAMMSGSNADELVQFLKQWYPIVRERVAQRATAEQRREALLALAERLNPGGWATDDDVADGLPRAAEALQQLSRVLTRRRRRGGRPRPLDSAASVDDAAELSEKDTSQVDLAVEGAPTPSE
jgi:hypothetical protein